MPKSTGPFLTLLSFKFPRSPFVGNSVYRGNLPLTALLFSGIFSVGEVAARNFVLHVGRLGRTEPVVQPASTKGSIQTRRWPILLLGKGERQEEGIQR